MQNTRRRSPSIAERDFERAARAYNRTMRELVAHLEALELKRGLAELVALTRSRR